MIGLHLGLNLYARHVERECLHKRLGPGLKGFISERTIKHHLILLRKNIKKGKLEVKIMIQQIKPEGARKRDMSPSKGTKCKKGKIHHYILDAESKGICKYCGKIKQFDTPVETNSKILTTMQFNPGIEKVSW